MIDKEFAIGTYEIELLTNEELNYVFSELPKRCKYIDTAINYNNDYILRNYNMSIISKIAPCHYPYYEFMISNHLKWLNRDSIDIMLIHSNRGDWYELAKKLVTDTRFKEIGVSNFNIDDIQKFKQITGQYPKYNEIEINPQYVDELTINFCKDNNIKIIAYCILGGKYNAMRFVANYSLPYLVQFASNLADIIILRADSFRQTNEFMSVINNYIEQGTNEYIIPMSNHKSMQPMKYNIPSIKKKYKNRLVYSTGCGENDVAPGYGHVKVLECTIPENFEMLGDYKTYFRYMFRKNMEGQIYDKDFLLFDDNRTKGIVYLLKDGELTKVNEKNVDITFCEVY